MTWTAIRTLTTQAAESAPSDITGFVAPVDAGAYAVDGNRLRYVEIAFDALTLNGSPTSVTFAVWRASDGKIDRLGSIAVTSALAGTPPPSVFEFHGEQVYVTVESFAGGSSPNVAGAIRTRPVRR